MTDFKVTVEGIDSLEEEFNNEFMPRVNNAVTAGLNAVASDLTASLKQHIQTDVYAAYEPKIYRRRGSSGGMLDNKNFNSQINGNILSLDYSFDTETPIYKDDKGKPKLRWAWYTNSDDVIRAIQTNKGYPTAYPTDECEPRPFWNNFVVENFVDGKAEQSLVKGMNAFDSKLEAIAEKKNLIEASDTDSTIGLTTVPHGSTKNNYSDGESNSNNNGWDDEDLPF